MKALTPPLPGGEPNWIALNNQYSFELGMISQKKTPFLLGIAKIREGEGGGAPCPN